MKQIGHVNIELVDFLEFHLKSEKIGFDRVSKTLIIIRDGDKEKAETAICNEEFMASLQCLKLGFEIQAKDGTKFKLKGVQV